MYVLPYQFHFSLRWFTISVEAGLNEVTVSMMASRSTCLNIVYSIVYSGADQRTHQNPRHWPICEEFTGDRRIPCTNGQQRKNVSICWRHHVVSFLCHHAVYCAEWTKIIEPIPSNHTLIEHIYIYIYIYIYISELFIITGINTNILVGNVLNFFPLS